MARRLAHGRLRKHLILLSVPIAAIQATTLLHCACKIQRLYFYDSDISSAIVPLTESITGRTTKRLFAVGDSKSTYHDWIRFTGQNLTAAQTTKIYAEHASNFGVSGATAATLKTHVVDDLPAVVGDVEIILLNLGANDVDALPAEATWKTDMAIIINAIRANGRGGQFISHFPGSVAKRQTVTRSRAGLPTSWRVTQVACIWASMNVLA